MIQQPVSFGPSSNLADLIAVLADLVANQEYQQAVIYLKEAQSVIITLKNVDIIGLFYDRTILDDGAGRLSTPSLQPLALPVADPSGMQLHQYQVYTPDIAFPGFLESVLLEDGPGLIEYANQSSKLVRSALRARLDLIIGMIEVFSTPQESPYTIKRVVKTMSLVPPQVLALLGNIKIFLMPFEFTITPAHYFSLPMAVTAPDLAASGLPQADSKLGLYMLGIPSTPETDPDQVLLHELGFAYLDALSPERTIPLQLQSFLSAIIGAERFNALGQQEHIANFSHFFAYVISSYDPGLMASNAYHNLPGFALHGRTVIKMYEEFFRLSPQQIRQFGELFYR